ncbi:hypothetical protein Tco_1145694 [Tanacetum coccineum]
MSIPSEILTMRLPASYKSRHQHSLESFEIRERINDPLEMGPTGGSLQKDRATVRAEIKVLRRERLAYEQESMETRQALARSEAHCRALEARVTVLKTKVHRHEWQRQAAE